MDQQDLRKLEDRCIQEQPPRCVAACPLHVDARALAVRLAEGDWDGGWKVLRKNMPWPGLLGRICDGPCRDRCLRQEAGGAVQINALERACVSHAPPAQRPAPLPPRDKKILVVGAGLSGLTATWDLRKKGYSVTLLESGDALGQALGRLYPELPFSEVIEPELALLRDLKVDVVASADLARLSLAEESFDRFDAVCLSLEVASPEPWRLDLDSLDPTTGITGQAGLFAGGRAESPVWRAAEGRWAATSIDRYLQNVSPTAGREKDGPYETRLFTSLAGVQPAAPVPLADPAAGYSEEEAIKEAGRCLGCECLECVKVCPYLERFNAYPKKYAREIYNNESIVMGSRQANKLINSCSLCGLCQEVCPEDFAMQDLCLQARRSMVRRGKMPPSAHEFALLDMAFSQSDRFRLTLPEPGMKESAYAFFPGCQLSAVSPGQVPKVYNHLRERLSGGVGLILGCCGAPALWAGREEAFEEHLAGWREVWRQMSKPQLIMACSTCFRTFKDHWPEVQIVSLWRVFEAIGLPRPAVVPREPLALHDPCTTRREPEIQESVRRLLKGAGVCIEELALGREKTECCGYGGLMQCANPDLAREVARRRVRESQRDFISYCAMCRDNLATEGKRVMHLLDLFFPLEDVTDPADRPRVGWSERRENRARLKDRLLKEFRGRTRRAWKNTRRSDCFCRPRRRSG
ncbi:MAG: pyridine nucleotide-disulfide oxidoreductase/dicluster-binding protein [Thermodesulfobacteriota bacterium]